jgi:hemolysin III
VRAINVRSDTIEPAGWKFPHYTATEAAADRALHLLALLAAIVAVGWLLLAASPTADADQRVACVIYGCGLIGMLTASAAYSLSRPSRRKELLRQVDHAMIFVMIAGTYTPFAVSVFSDIDSPLLCLLIWSLAAIGVGLTLRFPRRFERLLLMLYLIMGWMVLGMGRNFLAHAAYTIGAFVHILRRFPFQNVIWHVFVVLGAGLHWIAIAQTLAGRPPVAMADST